MGQASIPGLRASPSGYINELNIRSLRGCSIRSQFGGFNAPSRSSGTRKGVTYRTWDRIAARGNGVGSIQFHYTNAYGGVTPIDGSSGGEVADLQPLYITASLEYHNNPYLFNWLPNDANSNLIPITFNGGNNLLTLNPNFSVWTDELFINFIATQPYYVNTWVYEPINGIWPIRSQGARGLANLSSEGSNAGDVALTLTAAGGTPTITGTFPGANTPVVPGSFIIVGTGVQGLSDTSGNITGTGISSGTINQTTGAVSVTLNSTPNAGTTYTATIVGGTVPVDETKIKTKSLYYSTGSNPKGNFSPDATRGRPNVSAVPRLRTLCIIGDSINEGAGGATGDVSWVDYSAQVIGLATMKSAIIGEKAQTYANMAGRYRRVPAFAYSFDRIVGNFGTNDILLGRSVSQIQNDLMTIWQAMDMYCPNSALTDLWWTTLYPRTSRPANVPLIPSVGPYTTAGAAYGPGAVTGIQSVTIIGNGTVGPYTGSFGVPTMIGSMISDSTLLSVVDSGSGGTNSTTLTGNGLSTGTHTPSTGAFSLTFSASLPVGQTVRVYAFSSGPSARNAINAWLFTQVGKKIAGVLDNAAAIELNPNSQLGSGSGQWADITNDTTDGTHPSQNSHQTKIPGLTGPNGTNPSSLWAYSS